jgi:putative transposase
MRDKILNEEKKIRRFQRILHHKKNRKYKRMTRRGILKIKHKINKCYYKIRNMTKDLHNKAANYLCKNYDRILLPEFRTQNMVRNNKKGSGKKRVSKTYTDDGDKAGKKALTNYNKRKRLNKRVKFVLNMLSHYRFRQHLIHKCIEYGCQLEIVTEEYTSKTCTNCGIMSDIYTKREKSCSECGYKIDRDMNGSRNILIKNIYKLL